MDHGDLIEKLGGLKQIILDNYDEAKQIIHDIEHEKTARG
jgi:hypothetical protein